jgi:hypothetical protein
LPISGSSQAEPMGINDSGTTVGTYTDADNNSKPEKSASTRPPSTAQAGHRGSGRRC